MKEYVHLNLEDSIEHMGISAVECHGEELKGEQLLCHNCSSRLKSLKTRHRHVMEMFDVLRLFEEWRSEVGGFNEKFITKQTWEDLVWMVFGLAGVACFLKEDGSEQMHQGRSGSDVCEHFFSQIRYINSNPNAQQANEGASAMSGDIGMDIVSFSTESKGNSGKRKGTTAEDLFREIKRNQN